MFGEGEVHVVKRLPLFLWRRELRVQYKSQIIYFNFLKKNFWNSLQTFLTKHCHYSITQSVMFQENKIPKDNEH